MEQSLVILVSKGRVAKLQVSHTFAKDQALLKLPAGLFLQSTVQLTFFQSSID